MIENAVADFGCLQVCFFSRPCFQVLVLVALRGVSNLCPTGWAEAVAELGFCLGPISHRSTRECASTMQFGLGCALGCCNFSHVVGDLGGLSPQEKIQMAAACGAE